MEDDQRQVIDVENEQQDEQAFIKHLTGVRAMAVEQFEEDFGQAMEAALQGHEAEVESRRLDRTRKQIDQLEERIHQGKRLAPARIAKLHDRIDELREEEAMILARIEAKPIDVMHKTEQLPAKRKVAEPPARPARQAEPVEDADSQEEASDEEFADEPVEDDFSDAKYKERLTEWIQEMNLQGADFSSLLEGKPLDEQSVNVGKTVETEGLQVPEILWERLLDYQKTGVTWLLSLFQKRTGGILGDEMGLGKTLQVIGMLAALQASNRLKQPVLILCPVTLMKQWIQEMHFWWPPLRVFRLHSCEGKHERTDILRRAFRCGHVIITSYGHLRLFKSILGKRDWRAVVLDEGHKIRNPDAEVTIACKQLRTPHRLILSGTPIQNGLAELWSLFDFIAPGRLGTLPVFKAEFAIPINAGGYVNASSLQVQTSYKCACLLRDLLAPNLLRRIKAEVSHELPQKQEKVLLCQITPYQRELYEFILDSDLIQSVLAGKRNILSGIDLLRKVCNHPGLLHEGIEEQLHGFPESYGDPSGKLTVVQETLKMWKEKGHRVLLFCQTRQMLDLIEGFIGRKTRYSYLRMDGNTGIKDRGLMVDRFNRDASIFIFLLTTKVGGLGLNLVGADRVLIYDPDWNPSTDLQARERAWRLGQTRPVTIYRLITAGTIEEKIYHRQLWKQYLTSRVLTDPKQSRFFKSTDLYDLFSLSPPDEGGTETGQLFSGLNLEIRAGTSGGGGGASSGRAKPVGDDSHILDSLFEMTGLHSAIEHDKLMERPQREAILVEREAERMAAHAAETLRRSRMEREAEPVEAVTWTGKPVGQKAKAMVAQGRVPSSAAILAAVRARNNPSVSSSEGIEAGLARVLDRLLRYFLDSHGVCRSEAIAERFKDSIQPGQEAAFRQLLKTIATFDAVNRSWKLKRDLFEQ